MKKKKNTKKHDSGRSMIEMVGVLAIMGLLTAGAFVLIQSGMQSQRRSRATDEVAALVAEMQNVNVDALENSMEKGKQTAQEFGLPSTTPLGSDTQYSVWKGDSGTFYVGITGLGSGCAAMAKRVWSGEPVSVECDSKNNLLIEYEKSGSGSSSSSVNDKCDCSAMIVPAYCQDYCSAHPKGVTKELAD